MRIKKLILLYIKFNVHKWCYFPVSQILDARGSSVPCTYINDHDARSPKWQNLSFVAWTCTKQLQWQNFPLCPIIAYYTYTLKFLLIQLQFSIFYTSLNTFFIAKKKNELSLWRNFYVMIFSLRIKDFLLGYKNNAINEIVERFSVLKFKLKVYDSDTFYTSNLI